MPSLDLQPSPATARGNDDAFRLARFALAAGLLLALYASLRPFGWHSAGTHPLSFLSRPWPLSFSDWDVFLNVNGYVALGACAVIALAPRITGPLALLLGVAGLSLFSLSMEALQTYLPNRSPSIVDLATNAGGALFGGIAGLALVPALSPGGALHGLRQKLFVPGVRADLGLLLLILWFIALLAPRTLLYANGDVRLLLEVQPDPAYSEQLLLLVEAVCAVVNLVALALLVRVIAANRACARWLFVLLVAAACVVRSTAFGLFWTSHAALYWLTPGAILGLALGVPAGLAVMPMPQRPSAAVAAVLLIVSTLIINLAPPNAYLYLKARPTRQHELAPLSMLSRTTAMIWPFSAVAFLGWRWARDAGDRDRRTPAHKGRPG